MMKKVFNPTVALMNRLEYPQKFMLISFLFVMPLALVIALLIPSINERINFTQKEIDGIVYLRPLRRLLEYSLQNKIVAHSYLSGNDALKEALLDNQTRIDAEFRALENINPELENSLKATEAFNKLKANWQELKDKTLTLEVNASDERHSEFIITIRALISLVGNTSNLILDPDLDSYYLMDAMLLKLPESQDLLAQTKLLGEQAISRKSLTAEERAQLIVLAGLIQSNLNATTQGMGFAFRNNPAQNLKPILTNPLQEFTITTEMFLEVLQQELITPSSINPQSAHEMYPISANQALVASFNLWDQTVIELDGLLQVRINGFIQRKYLVAIVTTLGLGLVAYLWVGFYLAVMRTLTGLDDAVKRMVSGNAGQMIDLDCHDELSRMVNSFNEIASALVKAHAEAEQRVEERTLELSRTNESLQAEIVERKQIEQALRDSEDQLRLALDAARMGIWNWDVLTEAVTWSERVETIFGLGPGEFAGTYKAYLDFVPSADQLQVAQIVSETLAGIRADYHIEHRIIWPDGSLHWLEAKGRVYRDEAGQPIRMTGTAADITARKQAEVTLQESQAFLHSIYTGVGMAIFVIDVTSDGTFRYVGANPAYEQRAGLKSADLEGRTLEDLTPIFGPEVIAMVRQNYEQCLQANQIIYKEFHIIWQGQEIWYLDQLTPIHDITGRIIRIIGSTIDTTAIKQAESALRQSQQQYEALVNSIDGIVWEADAPTFQFSFVSQQAERFLGYPAERWLTEPTFWADHIHPDDRAEVVDYFLTATTAKSNHEFEYRMITADDRAVWLRDIVTVVVENDRPVKLRGIMVDITRSKQTDEALNRYAHRLEVLHEIDQAILAAHSSEEIAQTALRYLRQLVPCQRIGLNLFDFEAKEVVILAVDTDNEPQLEAGQRLPFKGNQHIINELRQGRIFEHSDSRPLPGGDILFAQGIRAGISVPLIVNEDLIGLVNLWDDKPDVFIEEHVSIAREVADQLAIAIQQARLFEAEAQRRQEAEALRDIAAALNNTLNLEEVLDRILANVGRVVRYDAADIMLIEAGIARIVRHHGNTTRALQETRLDLRLTIADLPNLRQMAESGQLCIIPDTQAHADWIDVPESRWIRSYASAPIRTSSGIIGFLSVSSETPGFFDAAVAERLHAFANQAAVTLENARLYAQSEHHAQRLHVLHEIDRAILGARSPDEIARIALRHIRQLMPCRRAAVSVFDFGTNEILTLAIDVDMETQTKVGRRAPLELYKNLISQLRQGEAVSVHVDVMPDALPPEIIEAAYAEGTYFGTLVPLMNQGELIGSVNLWEASSIIFSVDQIAIAREVADQLAIAIQQARLYAETKQRAEHLAVLHELDQAITASLDIDDVYRAFAQHTVRLLPWDHMSIGLVDGDLIHVVFPADEEYLTPLKATLPLKTLAGANWVIEQGQSLLSGDLASDQRFPPNQPALAMALHSALILPLRSKGQIIGAWFLGRRQVEGYQPADLTIAQSVAEQLAIAIENVRLFEQVQSYATELEQRVADRTRELSALYDVSAVASESLDLPTTLERSLERVLAAMRSPVGTIHLLDETGETLHLAVQHGFAPDLVVEVATLSSGDSLPGWVIEHADLLIVPDLAFDPRSIIANRGNLQAYAGVPMRANGQVLGVLSVARAREQPQFNVEEVALLTTIADQVGVVVESARLRQLAEQSAVIEERARLARDLHDSVTQLLYSVNLFASVGQEAYKLGDMIQVNNCLAELGQIAPQALKEMRLLVYELRPSALAQEGLVGALRQRLDAVERRTGVQTHLQADIMLDLPRPVEEGLYHIAQEALNNALKHAAATLVTVSIEASGGQIKLEVLDNGAGFDPGAVEGKGGLGLTSMRERIEKLNGRLTLLSTPGEGTKVSISLEV